MHRAPFAGRTHLWMLAALALGCGADPAPDPMATVEGRIVGDGSAPPLEAGASGTLDADPGLPDVRVVIVADGIWDTADAGWDSTVLLDHFTWILKEQPKVTPPPVPVTEPIILL